jgi:beta-lactamase regulating signal transducer with metallopeptidase domain
MQLFLNLIGHDEYVRAAATVIVDAAVKGAVIVMLAAVAVAALSRASAAVKHSIWTLALLGLAVVPILSGIPGWRAPILPHQFDKVIGTPRAEVTGTGDSFRLQVAPEQVLLGQDGFVTKDFTWKPATAREYASARTSGLRWLLIIWASGALVACARLIVSFIGIWIKASRGTLQTHGDFVALADSLASQYGIRRRFSLLLASDGTIPATWGLVRSTVSIPADALGWPKQRIRAVLLHELAHVARGDFVVQTLANVACAVHWFNPLVWYAFRRLRIESEQASDDLVLGAGLSPSNYAMQLVEVLVAARQEREIACGALAMAKQSELESRVRAILDAEKSRSGRSLRGITTLAVPTAGILLFFGLVRLEAEAHDAPKLERLPDGMTIEVIGISTHRSGKTTWWGPDGKPMAAAPCDPPDETVNPPGREVREVVARITGVPKGAIVNWSTTQSKSRRTRATRKDGQPASELQSVIADFPKGIATCDIHFDLSLGDWTTEQANEGIGGAIENGDRAFFFGKAHETQGGTAIAIAHNIVDRDVRIVAIDRDGKLLSPKSSSSGAAGHLKGFDAEFDLPPGKIREYQVQSRPVGRYEIKNVALQPRQAGE